MRLVPRPRRPGRSEQPDGGAAPATGAGDGPPEPPTAPPAPSAAAPGAAAPARPPVVVAPGLVPAAASEDDPLRALLDTVLATTVGMAGAPDRDALLATVCRTLTSHGLFRAAMVAADTEGAGASVRPIAAAGDRPSYFAGLSIPLEGEGPIVLALRTSRPAVAHDVATDPVLVPARDRLLAAGLRSIAAVPLYSRHLPSAVLVGYGTLPHVFGPDELGVLAAIGTGVSLALDAAADRADRLRLEERYERLLDELDAVVYELDVPTGRTFVSQHAQAVFGHSPEEMGRPGFWRSLVVPEDRERTWATWDGDEQSDGYDLEYRVVRADGRIAWIDERMRSVRGPDGRALRWFGVAFDVTDRRRMEDALVRAERLEAVSRVAVSAAHDFGNVLTSIRLFQGYLAAGLTATDPRRTDIEEIARAVERGTDIVRQLLALARAPEEGLDAHVPDEPMDLGPALHRLEHVVQRIVGPRVTVAVEAAAGHWARIAKGPFEQAILNVAINARDAMPDGGRLDIVLDDLDLDEEAEAVFVRPGRFCRIRVADTGHGMPPEVRARALEPLFTTKPEGSGIGLTSVDAAVRLAGGGMRVDSLPGMGATITLLLPTAPPPPPGGDEGASGSHPVA